MFYIPGNKGWGDYLGQGIAQGVNLGMQYGIPLMLQRAESKRVEDDLAKLEQWQQRQQQQQFEQQYLPEGISSAGMFRMPMPHMTSQLLQNQMAQNRLQQLFPTPITPYQRESLDIQKVSALANVARATKPPPGVLREMADPTDPTRTITALIRPDTGEMIKQFDAPEGKPEIIDFWDAKGIKHSMPVSPTQEAIGAALQMIDRMGGSLEKPLLPSQAMNQKQLDYYNKLENKEIKGTITEEEKREFSKMRVPGPLVSIDLGKPAPTTAVKEITDWSTLSATLNDLTTMLDQTKSLLGPGRQTITNLQEKYGSVPYMGIFVGGKPPKGILELEKTAANATDILGRLRTGAAINEYELALYKSLLPRIDLPYESNVRNVQTLQKFIRSKINQLQSSYSELGYKVPAGNQTVPEESQYKEGQTAVNPNTGRRIIFRNGKWQPVP